MTDASVLVASALDMYIAVLAGVALGVICIVLLAIFGVRTNRSERARINDGDPRRGINDFYEAPDEEQVGES